MDFGNLKSITILYVEDEEMIRDELIEILKEDVANLYIGKNGQEGLELYKKHQPDIVITDIRMPILNGLEMSRAILEIKPTTPIIITSAFNDVEYLMESIKLGIHYYIAKPVNLDELYTTLEQTSINVVNEQELQKSQKLLEHYKYAIDKHDIVSKTDKNGVITYVNEAFINISGYTEAEIIGKTHKLLRHEDMKASLFEDLWRTILGKKEWHGKIKNRAKDGSVYVVDSTIIPVLDNLNNIEEFISIRTDITQQELEKSELTQTLNEYEIALKNNTIFCRTDIAGNISTASKSFEELLGFNENSAVGSSYFNLIDSSQKDTLSQNIQKSVENAQTWNGILKHRTIKGELLHLNCAFIPISDLNGLVEEVLCFYIDITEQITLNEEMLHAQREIIYRMGAIGETRSKETGAHVQRVAEYSKLLALKYGLSPEKSEELKMASPMHDIGKVGIPDSILNKPGKLTVEEFEVMKTHASLGFEMLTGSNQPLLNTASLVAQTHHEKWDGSGYPIGLSGEDIHIYGRITAVADVFDALGHDRVYKKAWPLEDILSLFKEHSGKHFDPSLIKLFMDNLDEFLEIKQYFDEGNEVGL